MKTTYKFLIILIAAILGLMVGDYLGPLNRMVRHWDMFIHYDITIYLKMYDVFIYALSVSVFLIIPIKYFRFPIWLVVVLAYGSIFLCYVIESIYYGYFLNFYAFQNFFWNLIPISIGIFSVVGLWYFIVENFINKKQTYKDDHF
jgi:hypothetical protein